jgi:hypothetical protein
MYKARAESVKPVPIHQLKNFNIIHSTSVLDDDDTDEIHDEENNNHYYEQQGWALSESKNVIRYSPEQIKYLTDKYDEGEASGHKWNPSAVSSVSNSKINRTLHLYVFWEMKTKEENGRFVFESDQFLTPTQIRSFFSRLTSARRQQGNRTQSQVVSINQADDEDIIIEQENEFDSGMMNLNEDSLRSQASQILQTIQSTQLLTTSTTSIQHRS